MALDAQERPADRAALPNSARLTHTPAHAATVTA
jgi:hypothetical protein